MRRCIRRGMFDLSGIRKRLGRRVSVLLCVSMLFNMNLAIPEVYAENMDTEEIADEFVLDPAEDYEVDSEESPNAEEYEFEGGWKCRTADKDVATVAMEDGKFIITAKNKKDRGDGTYESEGVDITFTGSMNSADIVIKTDDTYIMTASKNKVVVNVVGEPVYEKELNIIYQAVSSNESSFGIEHEEQKESYLGGYRCYKYKPVEIDTSPNLDVYDTPFWDHRVYWAYSVRPTMDGNEPTGMIEKEIGDYKIYYNTNIPYFGKTGL